MYYPARRRRVLARPPTGIQRAPPTIIILVWLCSPGIRNDPTGRLPDLPGIFETVSNLEHQHICCQLIRPRAGHRNT